MKAILRFAAAVIFAGLSFVPPAFAQAVTAKVVATCGTQSYVVSSSQAITQDTTGIQCAGASGGITVNQGAPNAGGNQAWPVATPTPATINTPFHQTVTTSAVALTTQAFVNGVVITALPGNVAPICVGTSSVTTATGYCIGSSGYPQSISYGVSTTANIDIIGSNNTDAVEVTGN